MFQGADLILLNGASFASWTRRVSLPRSRLVDTSAQFEDALISTESVTHSHGDGGSHSHTGTASYVWLDFNQAIQQVVTIAAALVRRAPEAEDAIGANMQALIDDLLALDTEASAIGEAAGLLRCIASHPRYQYFARAYGLEIEAVEWDALSPPSETQWQELSDVIAETQSNTFIWEAEPNAQALDRMSALGLTNVIFPPFANRPAEGDFLTVMQANLQNIRAAVGS